MKRLRATSLPWIQAAEIYPRDWLVNQWRFWIVQYSMHHGQAPNPDSTPEWLLLIFPHGSSSTYTCKHHFYSHFRFSVPRAWTRRSRWNASCWAQMLEQKLSRKWHHLQDRHCSTSAWCFPHPLCLFPITAPAFAETLILLLWKDFLLHRKTPPKPCTLLSQTERLCLSPSAMHWKHCCVLTWSRKGNRLEGAWLMGLLSSCLFLHLSESKDTQVTP